MTSRSAFITHLDLPADLSQARAVLLSHVDNASRLLQNRALDPSLENTEKYPVQLA